MPLEFAPEAMADLRVEVAMLRGLIEAMNILAGEETPYARNALWAVIRQAQPLATSIDERLE